MCKKGYRKLKRISARKKGPSAEPSALFGWDENFRRKHETRPVFLTCHDRKKLVQR